MIKFVALLLVFMFVSSLAWSDERAGAVAACRALASEGRRPPRCVDVQEKALRSYYRIVTGMREGSAEDEVRRQCFLRSKIGDSVEADWVKVVACMSDQGVR